MARSCWRNCADLFRALLEDAACPNEEKNGPQQGDLDTILLLTNTTGSSLSIILTLRALDGTFLATSPQTLTANQTLVLSLSDLLP
jgi:hypothetical protein